MFRFGSPKFLLAVVIAALTVPAWSFAQAPTFGTLITTPVTVGSGFPEDATVGDINGDGKLDVMIPGINGLRVLLGNGNGTFVDQVLGMADVTVSNVINLPASLSGFLPRPVGSIGGLGGGIKTVDVNRDGKLDLVSVTTVGINFVNYSFVSVLINTGVNDANGVPQFTTTHHWMPFLGVRPVTVGDLNGDSWPDFIIGTCCNSIQVWTSNSGGGTFTPGQVFSLTPGGGGPSLGQGAIADLNDDGKADYVATSGQNGGANIFFGNGNGSFQTPGVFLANHAASVAVADVNGDNQPDLLMGNVTGGSEGLYVYLNNGGGAFGAPTLYAIPGFASSFSGGCAVAVADMNGDGKLDAVLSNTNSNSIAVLLGDASGGFGNLGTYSAGVFPTFLFVGDFSGDGKPDIGVDLRNSRAFGVLTNTTVFAPPLPTQTLTILGGSGNPGDIAANVEYYNPATGQWQPAFLANYAPFGHPVTHPWGNVPGTTRWINYKALGNSDPGAGPTTNQTRWYLYRVRFTVPADAIDPKMTFSLKADNFAQVAINGATAGGTAQFINNAWVNNVVVGTADQVNVDAAFSQNVHVGENTITLNIGDWGGLNGFNFRIDLSMKSSQGIEIVPVTPDTTAPAITAPVDITVEAASAAGTPVSFTATATDDIDGPVAVLANPASGSTFAIGTTPVALTARDAAGNIATAAFNVTVQDTIAPVVSAPASIVVEATSAAGAVVAYPAATATDAVGVTSISSNPPSGSTFPLGGTTVTATARDAAGNIGTAGFAVTVVDTTAPSIASATPSTGSLWPPNHKMVGISVSAVSSDLVGITSLKIINVTSSEPDNGLGDGDTAGDIVITGPLSVNVRAERSGNGNGRTYTITLEAKDAAGNISTKTCTVVVPKSQGK